MLKRIIKFLNKPKEKRLTQKEEIRRKLPKKTFARKFYGFTKDLKNETIVLKSPRGKILYQREGKENQAKVPFDFFRILQKKGVNLSKCTLIHNHTCLKNSDITILPSITDINTFFKLYREFKMTNYSILLIDQKTMQEFGRCFLNLSSEEVKTRIKSFKSDKDLDIWFNTKTKWFGRDLIFLTLEDLKHLGFNIKYQGINGHKYNPDKGIFEN
jgi:hypothetical protein